MWPAMCRWCQTPGALTPGPARGLQRALRLLVVPQVHAVVVRRVQRGLAEHLVEQRVDRGVADDRQALAPVVREPVLDREERLRLDVVGELEHDRAEVLDELL